MPTSSMSTWSIPAMDSRKSPEGARTVIVKPTKPAYRMRLSTESSKNHGSHIILTGIGDVDDRRPLREEPDLTIDAGDTACRDRGRAGEPGPLPARQRLAARSRRSRAFSGPRASAGCSRPDSRFSHREFSSAAVVILLDRRAGHLVGTGSSSRPQRRRRARGRRRARQPSMLCDQPATGAHPAEPLRRPQAGRTGSPEPRQLRCFGQLVIALAKLACVEYPQRRAPRGGRRATAGTGRRRRSRRRRRPWRADRWSPR